jgi:hypothetical protein
MVEEEWKNLEPLGEAAKEDLVMQDEKNFLEESH